MRELMLKLLTYEPFEKIKGDEKKFVSAVLSNDITTSQNFSLHYELMDAFKRYVDSDNWDDRTLLGIIPSSVLYTNLYSFL